LCCTDRTRNGRNVILNNAPAIRRKRYNRDLAARQVLLVFEREIAREENVVSSIFGCFEQLAILEPAESDIHCRGDFVARQMRPQLMGHVLVEQNSQGWSRGLWE